MPEGRKADRRPLERLKRKLVTENLWIVILKMLEKRELYGYQIRERIRKDMGFWIGNVTAYKVLYDLERGGYVKSEESAYRKHYSLTHRGRKELADARRFLRDL